MLFYAKEAQMNLRNVTGNNLCTFNASLFYESSDYEQLLNNYSSLSEKWDIIYEISIILLFNPSLGKNILNFLRNVFSYICYIVCIKLFSNFLGQYSLNEKAYIHKNYNCSLCLKNQDNMILNWAQACINQNIDQGRSYNNVNIDISDCFFIRSSNYNNNGGIIFVNQTPISMIVSFSMFFQCYCDSSGGAIYFSSTNAELRKICACKCSAYQRHFAQISTSLDLKVEYLSSTSCSSVSSGYISLDLFKGNQKFVNSNSSMNFAEQVSCLCVNSPSFFESSMCTFSNCNAKKSFCIYFEHNEGTMAYANIVNNHSPFSFGVVHVIGGKTQLKYCIFYSNQATLFSISFGTLDISHCFLSPHAKTSTTGSNNSITQKNTYHHQFFNSFYCFTDISIITPMKSLDRTPLITLINTPKTTPILSPIITQMKSLDRTPIATNIMSQQITLLITSQFCYSISSQLTIIPSSEIITFILQSEYHVSSQSYNLAGKTLERINVLLIDISFIILIILVLSVIFVICYFLMNNAEKKQACSSDSSQMNLESMNQYANRTGFAYSDWNSISRDDDDNWISQGIV